MTPAEASQRFMTASRGLPTLFDLTEEFLGLLALMDSEDAPDDPDLENALTQVETELGQKIEGYCSVIRSLESIAAMRKAEADRLAQRAAQADRAADYLRARLLKHMQVTEQQRIETARFTISVRKNPPKVNVWGEDLVPAQFTQVVQAVRVDKDLIKRHWKASGEIPTGCTIEQSERVQIA